MKPLTVVLFAAGGLLIYAGVKNKDPRTVIRESLTTSRATNSATTPAAPAVRISPDTQGGGAARV